jgi:hypothetical protein
MSWRGIMRALARRHPDKYIPSRQAFMRAIQARKPKERV